MHKNAWCHFTLRGLSHSQAQRQHDNWNYRSERSPCSGLIAVARMINHTSAYFERQNLSLSLIRTVDVIQQMAPHDANGRISIMQHYCQHDSLCFILFMLGWMVKVWIRNGVLNRIPAATGTFKSDYIHPWPQSSWTGPPAGSIPSTLSVCELLETFLHPKESSRCSKDAWFFFLFSKVHARKSNLEADSCSTLQTGRLSNMWAIASNTYTVWSCNHPCEVGR